MASFGLAELEASACGRPVVASNVGGLPAIVQDSVTGYLVEAHSAEGMAERLCDLLRDGALRSRMGSAARQQHAETLSWERATDSLMALYLELVPAQTSSEMPAAGG